MVQSLYVLLTTRFHERVMLRYFGSFIPAMLGENLIERTVVRFFYAMAVAIELWEPRFRLIRIVVLDATRSGLLSFRIEGVYYPNAHLEDFQTEQRKSLIFIAGQTGVTLTNSFETGAAA